MRYLVCFLLTNFCFHSLSAEAQSHQFALRVTDLEDGRLFPKFKAELADAGFLIDYLEVEAGIAFVTGFASEQEKLWQVDRVTDVRVIQDGLDDTLGRLGQMYFHIWVNFSALDFDKARIVDAVLDANYQFAPFWDDRGFLRVFGPLNSSRKILDLVSSHPHVIGVFGRPSPPPDLWTFLIIGSRDTILPELRQALQKSPVIVQLDNTAALIAKGPKSDVQKLKAQFHAKVPPNAIWVFGNDIFSTNTHIVGPPAALTWFVTPTAQVVQDLNTRLQRYGAKIEASSDYSGEFVLIHPDSSFALAAIKHMLPSNIVRVGRSDQSCAGALNTIPFKP